MARRNESKIQQIRIEFEYGSDLNKLAIKYKIPLSTINKRKAKDAKNGDPWIKGCMSKVSYQEKIAVQEKTKEELCKIIDDKARERLNHLSDLLDEREGNEGCELNKDLEEAYIKRTNLISNLSDIRKKIERVYTEPEELDIEKRKLEIELKKIEIEDKQIDIAVKKTLNNRILKKGGYYANTEDVS